MEQLRISLLGDLDARLSTGRVIPLTARKAQALLAYLAHRPGQSHTREKLAALLWGDAPAERARHSLRQALLAIRQDLAQTGETYTPLLIEEAHAVALNPAAAEVDVHVFERLVGQGSPEALEQAMVLYRGDLLEGLGVQEAPFEEWLLSERERLRELAQEAMARLLAHRMKAGPADDAIRVALRLLALDPTQESVHRALMTLYAQQGRRGAALRQYQACVRTLQRELGSEPEPETRQLYRAILQQRPAAATAAPARPQTLGMRPEGLSGETPLIGRTGEMARLYELVGESREGQAKLVIVRGEAGIGKTRLVMELAAQSAFAGPVLVGRSYETQQAVPFGPWVDALRAGWVAREEVLDELDPVWRDELTRLLPEVGGHVQTVTPGPEQSMRLFEAVARLLEGLTRFGPLLLVVEDLQWADEMSVRLLGFLVRRLAQGPVLLVATVRDEDVEDAPLVRGLAGELTRDGRLVTLSVAPLSREGTVDLVRALGRRGSDTAELEELAAHVWTASGGHPFTVVEMMRTGRQDWTAASPGPVLPEGAQALVARRLERLSARARELVAVAAAIGRTVEFDLLARAAGLGAREAADAVEELVRRRVLQGVGERFDFAHERIRTVVYASLIEPRRAALHGAVAEALEALHGDRLDEVREHLAFHDARAGRADRAVQHLEAVADQAARVYAYARAAAALDEVAGHLRRSLSSGADRRVLEIVLRQAFFLSVVGRFREIQELLARERQRLERVGDPALVGPYFFRLGLTHQNLGAFTQAIENGTRALAAADACGDTPTAGKAHYLLAVASYYVGKLREGLEHTRKAIELLEPSGETHWLGLTHWIRGFLHTALGEFAEAEAEAAATAAIGVTTGDPRLQSFAAWVAGIALVGLGQHQAGIEACRRAVEVGLDPFSRALGTGRLGWAHLEAGEAATAMPLLESAAADMLRFGLRHVAGQLSAFLGEALLRAGQRDAALARAREGLAMCLEANYPFAAAWAERAIGRIVLAGGASAEARRHLHAALERFTAIGARYEAERTRRVVEGIGEATGPGPGATTPAPGAPVPEG